MTTLILADDWSPTSANINGRVPDVGGGTWQVTGATVGANTSAPTNYAVTNDTGGSATSTVYHSATTWGNFRLDSLPFNRFRDGTMQYRFRYDSTANSGYAVSFVHGGGALSSIDLLRITAGVSTTLTSVVGTAYTDNLFGMNFVGSVIEVYANDVLILSATDSTYTTGRVGFTSFTNFDGEETYGSGTYSWQMKTPYRSAAVRPAALTLALVNTGVGTGGLSASDLQLLSQAVWQYAIEGGLTAEQSMRLQNSILGGKVSGANTATEVFRDIADTKNRVTATVDENGNRTAIVRDLT